MVPSVLNLRPVELLEKVLRRGFVRPNAGAGERGQHKSRNKNKNGQGPDADVPQNQSSFRSAFTRQLSSGFLDFREREMA